VAGSSAPPAGTSFVAADRDVEDGLATVASIRWDAVVVVSRQPGHVRRTVRDLRGRHWVFVSSGNVYADFSTLEQDEDSALLAPLDGDVMESMEAYGPAKVACENATARGGPGCLGRHGRP
jgi:2'-hydroxyisoflavone reductase